MAIDHRNLPDDALHEPKGISSAGENLVYVSDGSASGNWDKVKANSLEGTLSDTDTENRLIVTNGSGGFSLGPEAPVISFGQMVLTNNGASVSVPDAVDNTLNSNSDYVSLNLSYQFPVLNNMSSQTYALVVDQTGFYHVDFWANLYSSVNSTTFALKFLINGSDYVARRPKVRLPNSGELDNFSANGINFFEQGDVISIVGASNVAANITIEDMVFSLQLLEAS